MAIARALAKHPKILLFDEPAFPVTSPWILLSTILLCGLLTFLTRLSFVSLGKRLELDRRFESALRYVPVGALGTARLRSSFARGGAST